jgi:hypothetical protein
MSKKKATTGKAKLKTTAVAKKREQAILNGLIEGTIGDACLMGVREQERDGQLTDLAVSDQKRA